MDSNVIGLTVVGVTFGLGLGTAMVAMVVQSGRASREAMRTLAELFKQHTTTLENLKAIESGPEGMRGVVARSQPRFPTILDDGDEEADEQPSPGRGHPAYVEVGHGFPPMGDERG